MDWWQLVGLAFIAWFVLVLLFTPRIDYQVTVPLRPDSDDHPTIACGAGKREDMVTLGSLHVNRIVVAAAEDLPFPPARPQQHRRGEQLEAIVTGVEDAGGHGGPSLARARVIELGEQPASEVVVNGSAVVRVDEREVP